MCRTNYWVSYTISVFLSSKPYMISLIILNVLGIIFSVYLCSNFFISYYDDPSILRPKSQNYFWAVLLGVLSPIPIHFIRIFIIKFFFSTNFSFLLPAIEYPLSDWLLSLMIAALAYLQLEKTIDLYPGAEDRAPLIWHIFPKQAYIFGLTFAVNSYLLAVLVNLNVCPEMHTSMCDSNSSNICKPILVGASSEELNKLRKSISLSRCVDIRRNSSKIADNIYQKNIHSKNQNVKVDDGDTLFVEFPSDKINSNDFEDQSCLKNYSRGYAAIGYKTVNPIEGEILSKVTSTWGFLKSLLIIDTFLLSFLFSTIGQALLFSIYFIYIPGHDELFSTTVVYFGKRSLKFFLIGLVVPYSLINYLYHVLLCFCKRFPSLPARSDTSSVCKLRDKALMFSPDVTTLHFYSTDPYSYITMESPDLQDSLRQHESNCLVDFFGWVILEWRKFAAKKWSSLTIRFLWSTLIFYLSIIAITGDCFI